MVGQRFNIYFFLIILACVTVGGFLLIKPFLSAIFIAALCAILFMRPYEYLSDKIHSPAIASAIMLCVVVITIILPIIFISGLVVNEISHVITESTTENSVVQQSLERAVVNIMHMPIFDRVLQNFTLENINQDQIVNVAQNVGSFFQAAYQGVVNGVIGFFVMFFTLFYFFIDGRLLIQKIMDLTPLRNEHEHQLITEFTSMTRATLKGTVVIGCIQGMIGGLAFVFVGIMSPILWTVIMIVFSIIPAVGAGFVIFPAALIMLLLGNIWQAIFLVIVGVFVSIIDNILRPKLVGKDVQMHTLAVFFATLGGLQVFGFIGFIVGPIVMALMLAMWKIYAVEFRKQLKEFNA